MMAFVWVMLSVILMLCYVHTELLISANISKSNQSLDASNISHRKCLMVGFKFPLLARYLRFKAFKPNPRGHI